MISVFIRFFLERKLVVGLLLAGVVLAGVAVAPFDWDLKGFPRHPVPVDAIPNLGENQQIVFTEWPGRSPQDVENQVTYPLASALMGVPGVREVRSTSMFFASSSKTLASQSIGWNRTSRLSRDATSLARSTSKPTSSSDSLRKPIGANVSSRPTTK